MPLEYMNDRARLTAQGRYPEMERSFEQAQQQAAEQIRRMDASIDQIIASKKAERSYGPVWAWPLGSMAFAAICGAVLALIVHLCRQ